jgi:hypothetical protein
VILIVVASFAMRGEATGANGDICVSPYWLQTADWDLDGRLDVVAVANRSNAFDIAVALGDGRGAFPTCLRFTERLPLSLSGGRGSLVFADFTEDGLPDVLAVDASGNPPELGEYGPSRLLLFASSRERYVPVEVLPEVERRLGHFPIGVGDIDLDGHLDAVFGARKSQSGYLQVLWGTGGTAFDVGPALDIAPDESFHANPEDIRVEDLSGDGRPDVAVLFAPFRENKDLRVYVGLSDRSDLADWRLAHDARMPAVTQGVGLETGDLTGDGILDIVVVSGRGPGGEQVVLVHPGLPDGAFGKTPIVHPVAFDVLQAVPGDFDDDGQADVILCGQVLFQPLLSSRAHLPDASEVYSYDVRSAPHSPPRIGDIDGDGHADMVVPDSFDFPEGDPQFAFVLGLGGGRYDAVRYEPGRCGQAGPALLSDLNEDGLPDLLALKNLSIDPLVLDLTACLVAGQPAPSPEFFQEDRAYPDLSNLIGHVLGDFNGDRHDDIAYGRGAPAGFSIRHGSGDGSFGEPLDVDVAADVLHDRDYAVVLASRDFDRDGTSDLVVMGSDAGDPPSEDKWRLRVTTSELGGIRLAWEEELGAFKLPEIVDLNGDGADDILVVDSVGGEERVWAFLGSGDGGFDGSELIGPERLGGGEVLDIAAADFSEDGAVDIVCALRWADLARGMELVLFRSRPGGFAEPVTIAQTSRRSRGLGVFEKADVNGDAHLDLVAGQSEWFSEATWRTDLAVLYGYGDGTFTGPRSIAIRPFDSVALRDLDGDGLLDFILAGGGWRSAGVEVILQEEPFVLDAPPKFHRGDANDDGTLNLSDAIAIFGYLFTGSAAPPCLETADAADDGEIVITDAIQLLQFLFLGGPPPAPPGPPPEPCGKDPEHSQGDLGCLEYTHCG